MAKEKIKGKKKLEKKRITAISASFSGPLPPPNILQGYENIQSGFADRIIKMAECQASHRQNLEKKVVDSNTQNEFIGMCFAFVLTVSLMSLGFYLIINDKSTAGYFALFGPVVFHASNYIYNKRKEGLSMQNNRQE